MRLVRNIGWGLVVKLEKDGFNPTPPDVHIGRQDHGRNNEVWKVRRNQGFRDRVRWLRRQGVIVGLKL